MEVAGVAMQGSTSLDEAAVRAFLITDYPRIVAAVAMAAGSRASAEDAVAEALARAWERSERGETIESLSAWVTAAAVNLARSRLRRIRVEAEHRRKDRSGLDEPGPSGDRVDVQRALAGLPRREREVTVLRYHLDLDVAGIASVLAVSEGTVKTLLFRARRRLAIALGEPDEEMGP